MTTTQLHARLRLDSQPSLVKACRVGYFFCKHCKRVTFDDTDKDEPAICPHCRHKTLYWHPPVLPKCD